MYTKHRQKKILIISTECGRSILFVLLLLLNIILETVSGESKEQAGELRGQTVVPRWLSRTRNKREAGIPLQAPFPDRGEIVLTAEGKKLLLQVERNQ
ncbi:hypothetical protein ANANG_G00137840 [Anguilla anguilla]|uniref:Uncharacterized protein n=1 Tax=Anguilla anguilla TaxID=7936 RepID=A0A9D3MA83_ANGAN|nr:hypothetical protein ANANG_G00137840 [Anguilla anguilla]